MPLRHISGHDLEKWRLLIAVLIVLVWRVGQVLLSLLLRLIMLDGLKNLEPRATVPLEKLLHHGDLLRCLVIRSDLASCLHVGRLRAASIRW